jgi:hypothetical protein
MTDSIALLGATALTEGIKFLYGQVSELIKRYRERRDRSEAIEIQPVRQPGLLAGELARRPVNLEALRESEPRLLELRRGLTNYVDGLLPINAADTTLLEQVESLRRLLENIYGQHITFAGEQRPSTGTPVVVRSTSVVASGERSIAAGTNYGIQVTGDNAEIVEGQ